MSLPAPPVTTAIQQAVHCTWFGQVPLVTGLTDDLVLTGGRLRSVADGLAEELRRIYPDITVAVYDIVEGLRAQREEDAAALRRLYVELREEWVDGTPGLPPALDGGMQLHELEPEHAPLAVAALVRQAMRPVGMIIDHADLLLTRAMYREDGRYAVGALRSAMSRRGDPTQTKVANPLVLVASDPGSVDGNLATHPLVQTVVIVPPALDERMHIVAAQGLSSELAQLASGLSRRRLVTLKPIHDTLEGSASPGRIVRVAVNGMPRRPWSSRDRARVRDQVAPTVRKSLPGQEVVVDRVCEALEVAGMPRLRAAGPRDVFLLAGPPAVGKTELTRLLAQAMFGDAGAIRRFDMTEYMESHSRAKLIGAPPGYVGFEGGGQLTDWVRSNPDSIVLLDEIEKAHEDVLLLLLQILEDGRLTDGRGLTVDFGGIVLFMTTNLGSAKAIEQLTASGENPDPEKLGEMITDLIRVALQTPRGEDGTGGLGRPELWSRLQGSVIPFDVVRRANVDRIVARLLDDFRAANAEAGYAVQFDVKAIAALIVDLPALARPEGTWDTRTILKYLRERVELPVRRELARTERDGTLHVGVGPDGRLTLEWRS